MTTVSNQLLDILEHLSGAPSYLRIRFLFEDIEALAKNGNPQAQEALKSLETIHKLIMTTVK